ncbi:MAG: triose-phosphate isomerase [Vulcanimicrobiaceae bacterium]
MRTIVAGNWKMNETATQARELAASFVPLVREMLTGRDTGVDVVVAPPFTALAAVGPALGPDGTVALGAQDMHWDLSGAFTGEISAPMLLDLGVTYVILGHSERRQYFGETDEAVNRKVKTAVAQGLHPIVAVGETLGEREAGRTSQRVVAQTRAALDGLSGGDVARLVLAYEPIWAIGTGKNCDAAEADGVMAAIRGCHDALRNVPILYGGSVKPDNFASYLARPNVDGGLIGGASLDANAFVELVRLAVEARAG